MIRRPGSGWGEPVAEVFGDDVGASARPLLDESRVQVGPVGFEVVYVQCWFGNERADPFADTCNLFVVLT